MTGLFYFVMLNSLLAFCEPASFSDSENSRSVRIASILEKILSDTSILRMTYREEDTIYNEYLLERLKRIRENFKRINSIDKWSSITKEEFNESTEGGEASFYYSNQILEKIITRHYGEMFQRLTEYYLLHGKLSFVVEKTIRYNGPIYYDSVAMKENDDDQSFNLDSSKIEEDRSYFENNKLIHQVNNEDCGSPMAADYLLKEEKRILGKFESLMRAQN